MAKTTEKNKTEPSPRHFGGLAPLVCQRYACKCGHNGVRLAPTAAVRTVCAECLSAVSLT